MKHATLRLFLLLSCTSLITGQVDQNDQLDPLSCEYQDNGSMVLRSRKNKSFCKICAKVGSVCNLTTCNLTVNGTLTLGGVSLNNLTGLAGAIGPAGAAGTGTGLGSLVQSIIPFSSGLITIGTSIPSPFPTTGIAMAYGSSGLEGLLANPVVTNTAFAFTVPHAGTLHDLQVSVDSIYAASAPSTPFTFTFTVYHSACTAGTVTPYTATALTATASTTAPAQPISVLTPGGAGCGSLAGTPVTVAAGDRIVMIVTSNAVIPSTTVLNLALSAGVMYTPA